MAVLLCDRFDGIGRVNPETTRTLGEMPRMFLFIN